MITGKVIRVIPSVDSPDSSYSFECWVDSKGAS